ncbi:MAG: hypothetical protein ACK4N4_04590 [Burkholderiales bacterium]
MAIMLSLIPAVMAAAPAAAEQTCDYCRGGGLRPDETANCGGKLFVRAAAQQHAGQQKAGQEKKDDGLARQIHTGEI